MKMMRYRLWHWLCACVTVAVVTGWFLSLWNPRRAQFMSEPQWVVTETGQEFDRILQSLSESAPEIECKLTVSELVMLLNDICPTQIDQQAIEDQGISQEEEFYFRRRDGNQKMADWLEMTLSPLELSYTIRNGMLWVGSAIETDHRNGLTRIYPCPVVDSRVLIHCLQYSSPEWEWNGGNASVRVIDTQAQSLVVIYASYSLHRWVEKQMKALEQTAGLGWRTERMHWSNLSWTALARWLDLRDPGLPNNVNSPTSFPGLPPQGMGGMGSIGRSTGFGSTCCF